MKRVFDTNAGAILDFYRRLRPRFPLPGGISIMNPYKVPETWAVAAEFYEKFYGDSQPRVFIFGINPGRFGGGVTGVPFTDPIRLADKCGIPNHLRRLPELSSEFIYTLIEAYGGVKAFYGRYFFSQMSPLGFLRDGKNLNYYDDKELMRDCESFMVNCIRRQLRTMPTFEHCFCLGEGENFKYFSRLNGLHGFFKEIIPLPHPRWVMQYRRRRVGEYVGLYMDRLGAHKA